MTEQNPNFAYAKTLQNTLSQNHIRRLAAQIMELNKARPDVVSAHIYNIRTKLHVQKLNQNVFKNTINKAEQLAALAADVARITRAKVGA